MSPVSTALPGPYNPDFTPWVAGMHEALDDPKVVKVVARKSAQVAWTDGVLLNYIAKRIAVDPCAMIIMFAKDQAAKEFNSEKFGPMCEVTPALARIIPQDSRRSAENKQLQKVFPGGFLKFVTSNSAASVKSTSAPVVAVEEPDDCNANIKGQGDTIKLLEERTKTFPVRKIIFGGTPTVDGLSRVDAAYKASDQRKFFVPCPHCGELQTLKWEQVRWQENESLNHEIFGHADPETAVYVCEHCGAIWTEAQRHEAVKKGKWIATAPFTGVAGFAINELYSPFPASRLPEIVKKYLEAAHELEQGDDSYMRSFLNNQLGIPYVYQSGLPDAEELEKRAENYEEFTVPANAFVLTAGVDVQHDRLAVVIRAWGRGEESWLVWWGEIFGQTMVKESGAWVDLDALLSRKFKHACGAEIGIRAVSIDSSDGQTSDAVYDFVRKRVSRGFMAIKGSSSDKAEIFSIPKQSIDMGKKRKAAKYGLRPYIVGVDKAKDLWLGVDADAGRIRLTGNGPARVHWYKGVRADYWEQITSEVKAPHPTIRRKKIWQLKSGLRNEALDCEMYALHAARSLKIHLWKEDRWQAEEQKIRQMDLVTAASESAEDEKEIKAQEKQPVVVVEEETKVTKDKKVRRVKPRMISTFGYDGWSAESW